MKTKSYHPIRALRQILNQTQGQFAATIGASKDTVASWETGRNPVSHSMARRIAVVTGVDDRSLMNPELPLLTMNPNPQRQPYTWAEFEKHRKQFWGKTVEEQVSSQMPNCQDALELLFTAAAQYGSDTEPSRLPGLIGSFIQWCEMARKDFELEAGIDSQLATRKKQDTKTQSYGQWRALAKEMPSTAKFWGFVDDPKRDDQEPLSLKLETIPTWNPGHGMRGPKR